jgi:hypothetical protein
LDLKIGSQVFFITFSQSIFLTTFFCIYNCCLISSPFFQFFLYFTSERLLNPIAPYYMIKWASGSVGLFLLPCVSYTYNSFGVRLCIFIRLSCIEDSSSIDTLFQCHFWTNFTSCLKKIFRLFFISLLLLYISF